MMTMMAIPAIAVPCRACHAAPGAECVFADADAGHQLTFHPTRENDAALVVQVLIDLAKKDAEERARVAASPAVVRRSAGLVFPVAAPAEAPESTSSTTSEGDGSAGLVFFHEASGGDGRYHMTTGKDDACPCGAKHHDRDGKPFDPDRHGFSPPWMFCESAAVERERVVEANRPARSV